MSQNQYGTHFLPEKSVFCVGIYGSASTWAYNVCRMLVMSDFGEDSVASLYADAPLSGPHPSLWCGPAVTACNWKAAVIKMHEGSQEAFDSICSGAVSSIVTVRDPRDAIVSVMQRFHWNFDTAFDRVGKSLDFIDRILQEESTLVLRYEDSFMCKPQSILKIAAHLHIHIDAGKTAEIFSELGPECIDNITRGYSPEDSGINVDPAGRLYDRTTHWHQQHRGDGRVGKWREYLRRSERKMIRDTYWKEITRLGYASLGW